MWRPRKIGRLRHDRFKPTCSNLSRCLALYPVIRYTGITVKLFPRPGRGPSRQVILMRGTVAPPVALGVPVPQSAASFWFGSTASESELNCDKASRLKNGLFQVDI